MARGRLISKTLGTSSKRFVRLAAELGKLGEFAQALYPLIVASTDDFGRCDGDAFTVKNSIWPTSPRCEADFERALIGMATAELIDRYEVDGRIYLQVRNFDEHQPGLHKRRSSKFPEVPGNAGKFPEIPSEGKGRELKGSEGEGKALDAPAPAALLETWNAHRGALPEASKLTDDRKRHATARLKDRPELDWWASVVKRMASSAFCRGEVGREGWRADFDFLLRPGTAERVLEGKYDGTAKAREPPNGRVVTWTRDEATCPNCGHPGGQCAVYRECQQRQLAQERAKQASA